MRNTLQLQLLGSTIGFFLIFHIFLLIGFITGFGCSDTVVFNCSTIVVGSAYIISLGLPLPLTWFVGPLFWAVLCTLFIYWLWLRKSPQ